MKRLLALLLLPFAITAPTHAEPVAIRTRQATRVLQYIAPTGKTVREGEIIAVLDCLSICEDLQEVETELAKQSATARSKETEITRQEAANVEKEADAAYEITKADRVYQKYLEGDAPAQELALQLALNEAEAGLKKQTDRYNARDKLLQDGYIQKVEYEAEEVLLQKSKLTHDAAQLKLKAFIKYERAQATEQYARTLKEKKAAVETVKKEGDKAIEKLRAELAAAQKSVKALTIEKDQLTQQLDKTVIIAPTAGTLALGDPARPDLKIRRGATVSSTDLLGTITP